MAKLVMYEGADEVLVCTKKNEHLLLEEYFADGMGRNLYDYDRAESTEQNRVLRVENRVHANFE